MITNIYSIYLLVLLSTFCKAFPKDINKCHFGDNKCIVDSMNYVIQHYPKGISEIGLKPIDVVDIGDVKLAEPDENGVTWISINLTKQVNYGFENTTITNVEGFDKDPTSKLLTITGKIPSLVHKGLFDAKARRVISFLNMNLSGESTTEFLNLRFTLKLKVTIEYRNNTRYLKIHNLVPIVKIDRWILWMENLFPENTDLTIIVNRLFNERWLEIWNEWEPTILDAFSGVFLGMIKDTFDRIPYDDFFLPDLP